MPDDPIMLNVVSGEGMPSDERVQPATGAAAARTTNGKDAGDGAGRQTNGEERRESEGPVVKEGTFDQLEAGVVAANGLLHEHGIAVSLRLHRDEEGAIHLEIKDHRAAEGPIVRRFRIIEHDEITRLMNDILAETGICVDKSA